MKRIGFINWMFFFFLFLAFFHPHLKGILNSMENDYVDEKILEKSKDTHHFNKSALKLYRFPFNPQGAVMADKIPYEALTHIVLPGFINRSGGNEMDSIVYQEFIDLKDNKLFKRRLEDKHLLINFKFEDFENYSEHLNMVYVQLDSLGKHYTDSKLGIVFEVDLPLNSLAQDTLINSLSALSNFIPRAKKNLQGNRDIAHYLCVNYTDVSNDDSGKIKKYLVNLFAKADTIPNLKGYIVKTFDNKQNDLETFWRLQIILKSILKDSSDVFKRDDLIVCIPTYPVFAPDAKFTEKYTLKNINIESLNDSTRMFINNNIGSAKPCNSTIIPIGSNVDKVGYFNYDFFTSNRSDSLIIQEFGRDTTESHDIALDTVEFYSAADTLTIKPDTIPVDTLYKWENKYGADSLILTKTTFIRKTIITISSDTIQEGLFLRTETTHVDTARITETYLLKDMICFETQRTLQSKLDFFAEHNLNIGFWNEIEQPKVDGSTIKSSTPKNPVIELFNYAKSFFKKLLKLKLKGQPWEIHSPDGASTCSSWDCYWETIVADYKRGLPKTPDYFLVLFAPFLALRILMPLFTLFIFKGPLKVFKENLLEKLQINNFGITISGTWALLFESLFWMVIALAFILALPGESESVRTTRLFSILIVIFLILGRPVIKFLIKLFRLFGKSVGNSLLKKIWRQVIPHLGTLVNTNFFDEDEMNNAIDHVKNANKGPKQSIILGESKTIQVPIINFLINFFKRFRKPKETKAIQAEEGYTVLLFNLKSAPATNPDKDEL